MLDKSQEDTEYKCKKQRGCDGKQHARYDDAGYTCSEMLQLVRVSFSPVRQLQIDL